MLGTRVVFGGWAVLAVALVGFVARFGLNSPVSDEWHFVPELTGERPAAAWVLAPHNEHRYPLSRALWLGLHRLTGFDFRAPMLLSVVLLAGTSLALLRAARQVRGRSHPADLLIPALLLHFGHWENWLTGYQLALTVPVAAVGLSLAAVLTTGEAPSRGRVFGVGAAAMIAALNGGAGVLLGVPLAVWAALAAVRSRRWAGLVLPTLAIGYAAAAVLFGRSGSGLAASDSWADRFTTITELFAVGVGVVGRETWPVSGLVMTAAILAATAGLGWVALRRPAEDRPAAVGLLAVLLGVGAVAAAIAVSRAGIMPHAGFSSRYALFPALGLVAAYLAAVRFARVPRLRTVAPLGAVAALLVALGSVREGVAYAESYRFVDTVCRLQAQAGLPPERIVTDSLFVLYPPVTPGDHVYYETALVALARHRLGPYRL
jgi:hypothetical protein